MINEIKILGITHNFPTKRHPEHGVFVHSILNSICEQGGRVNVLAPVAFLEKYREPFAKTTSEELNWINGDIMRPAYVRISNRLLPWMHLGQSITLGNFRRVVINNIESTEMDYDFVYNHFFTSGWASIAPCKKHNIPSVVALGESDLEGTEAVIGKINFAKTLNEFSGIVAVSKENEEFCRQRCPSIGSRLIYLPNGVDVQKFSPIDQQLAREKLNLPVEAKIIVFCGHFIERKGPLRVLEALNKLTNVYGCFLGRGPQIPKGDKVLHAGPVAHDLLPMWLSAADMFVLPSLAEGMSNAILEALSCGLPVVVSDRAFNHEFLSDACAMFVNPLDIDSIANGIESIVTNESTAVQLKSAALEIAQKYSLRNRINKLVEFGASLS